MALSISDLWTKATLTEIKTAVLDTAEAVGLPVRSWILGDPSERWTEIWARTMDQFLSTVITEAVRGFFLDQSTDPGDDGSLALDQTPRPGWLSGLGEGWYGVVRRGETFATGIITITNNSLSPIFPKPGDIQVERSVADPEDGGKPTYLTTADPSIYVNPDGSVTIAAAASIDLPIQADAIGTYANANAGEITTVITGTFGSLAANNASPVLAEDREGANDYRTRCRRASSRVATGGPTALYEYAANTASDGAPLQRHDGTGAVGITRIWVDDAVTEVGSVTVYLADDDGGVDAVDVASADANITGVPLGVITNPIGVVGGSIDYTTSSAVNLNVPVSGSVKITTTDAGGLTVAELKTKILTALAAYFSTFPIGGLDKVSGAGFLYTSDLAAVVKDSYLGFYAAVLTAPAGASTALALGEVAVLQSAAVDWTVTIA